MEANISGEVEVATVIFQTRCLSQCRLPSRRHRVCLGRSQSLPVKRLSHIFAIFGLYPDIGICCTLSKISIVACFLVPALAPCHSSMFWCWLEIQTPAFDWPVYIDSDIGTSMLPLPPHQLSWTLPRQAKYLPLAEIIFLEIPQRSRKCRSKFTKQSPISSPQKPFGSIT
jgi:hypothetical protein